VSIFSSPQDLVLLLQMPWAFLVSYSTSCKLVLEAKALVYWYSTISNSELTASTFLMLYPCWWRVAKWYAQVSLWLLMTTVVCERYVVAHWSYSQVRSTNFGPLVTLIWRTGTGKGCVKHEFYLLDDTNSCTTWVTIRYIVSRKAGFSGLRTRFCNHS
jgi:hypothetical protein